jgi:hypothetical protein
MGITLPRCDTSFFFSKHELMCKLYLSRTGTGTRWEYFSAGLAYFSSQEPRRDQLKCVMTHAQKPDFVFRRKGRVHLNRRGRQFSRLLAAEVCASAVVMLDTCSDVVWRVLATHSIRQFPLHFPPVRHRVPSHFNWSLLRYGLVWWRQLWRHLSKMWGGETEFTRKLLFTNNTLS